MRGAEEYAREHAALVTAALQQVPALDRRGQRRSMQSRKNSAVWTVWARASAWEKTAFNNKLKEPAPPSMRVRDMVSGKWSRRMRDPEAAIDEARRVSASSKAARQQQPVEKEERTESHTRYIGFCVCAK